MKRLLILISLSGLFLSSCNSKSGLMNDKEIVNSTGEAALLLVEKIPRAFQLIENSTKANAFLVSQSDELEPIKEDEKEKLSEEEGIHISNTFYISALIIIIIAGYLMNKRKPLLNQ